LRLLPTLPLTKLAQLAATSTLLKLAGLSEGLAADASFARQARRKHVS